MGMVRGITRDSAGDVLGSVECFCFKDNGDNTLTFVGFDTSDASTGVYEITTSDNTSAYLVYTVKDNSPHVFDVTDRDLTPEGT